MIENREKIIDGTLATLLVLAQTELSFYPCGSRFFGGFRSDSDYDFFAPDAAEYRDFLQARGFRSGNLEDYFDVNTRSTWHREDVTVILVQSCAARLDVQTALRVGRAERPAKGDSKGWTALYQRICPATFPPQK